jgi:hypothetical protein
LLQSIHFQDVGLCFKEILVNFTLFLTLANSGALVNSSNSVVTSFASLRSHLRIHSDRIMYFYIYNISLYIGLSPPVERAESTMYITVVYSMHGSMVREQ